MNKVKSAICLTLMTLLVAALCFVCFASFPLANGIDTYNSILVMTDKDADLGAPYGGSSELTGAYLGGGYSAVYYPEGVISAQDYESNLAGYADEADKQEYEDKYSRVGSLYFENDNDAYTVTNNEPDEEFKAQFAAAAELIAARYEALHNDDVRVSVEDNYTIRVFVPTSETAAFSYFGIMGELTVRYGSSADSASIIMPARSTETIGDYIKSARTTRAADGSYAINIRFTKLGRQALANASKNAADSSDTLFIRVGETDVIQLSVSDQMDMNTLGIYNSSFTKSDASVRAILIDTALKGPKSELTLSMNDTASYRALYGENALTALYIVFGVFFVAMMVFFFVRYHLLAFAHLYTYLLFLCASLLCLWAIPFLSLSVETFVAFLLTSVLLSVSNAVIYEGARAEYALGKTMVSSVKTSYKKNLWKLFDLHIVAALIGFFTFFVSLSSVSGFAFLFALTAVFSGVFSLVVGRFNWAILMAYTPKKGAFCNFVREVVDDE